MKRPTICTILLGCVLCSMNVVAQGNGHGNGHGKGNPHNIQQGDDGNPGRGHESSWTRRDGWEYRTYDGDQRPPGWSHGKKKGWGDCDLPPGQAKKYGCNSYFYEGRQYHWYQDEAGRIIVRRPVISAHAGIDIH